MGSVSFDRDGPLWSIRGPPQPRTHIPVAANASAIIPQVKSGNAKMLAIVAESRMATFPNVPTLKEYGFKFDMRTNEVLAFGGPKGIPAEVVKNLEDAFQQAIESPEYKKVMEQLDNEPKFRDRKTFSKLIHELYPLIGQMIKEAGVADIAR